jgi:undecaprenyl-phosphate 4-deoxy-4-formamido-L-arabinose transferase
LVDDCSRDQSWVVIEKIRQTNPQVKTIQLMRNYGQHNALMCGFNYVKGKYIITMDDDLQHPPEEIPKLIWKIKEGYDVVYGVYESKKHGLSRNIGSKIIQWLYSQILGIKGELTAFRIIRREIIKNIVAYNGNFAFVDGLFVWYTNNIGHISVVHEPRKIGKSNYSYRKLLLLSMNLLTNFSVLPLQIASVLGVLFSSLGFLMALVYFVLRFFLIVKVSGFATVIIATTVFAGVQLLILGLIGEYLGRIQLNINSKPQFCIREKNVN